MALLSKEKGMPASIPEERSRRSGSVDLSLSKELATSRKQHWRQTLIHTLGQEPPQSSANRRPQKTTGHLFRLQYLTITPTMLLNLLWPCVRL